MQLTEEQKQIGRENFSSAAKITRRDVIKGTVAGAAGLGALYFGYQELRGDPVRVGFIGTGDEGNVLLTEHPTQYMDVVAVADLRPSSKRKTMQGEGNDARIGLVKKLGADRAARVRQFDDHLSLIAAKEDLGLEAVVIAVPLVQHAAVAMAALDAGLHVLTEKLMAYNIRECKHMIRKARNKKLLLAVGHQRHYSVLYDNAASICASGALGDIKFIRAQWHRNNSFPNSDQWNKKLDKDDDKDEVRQHVQQFGYESLEQLVRWRLFKSTGGGIMAELGSHQMDACSIFLGHVHPLAVQGYGGKNFYGVQGVGSEDKQTDPRDIDDHIYVTYEFPGKNYAQDQNDIAIATYSSINTNDLDPYGETVYGSRGTLMVNREQEALLFKEEGLGSQGGGPDQRLWVVQGEGGGAAVIQAYETTSGSAQATTGADWATGVSRGYTEEMEHFCYCIREGIVGRDAESVLRCPGPVAMADAIMALTANRAMALKKRIRFEDNWFDVDLPDTPEASHPLEGENPEDFLA